jgi:hypothetical protein
LVASALIILTLAGHTAGQGEISAISLLLISPLALGMSIATTARRLTWPTLLAVLLAGQALLHVVMTFAAPHAHGTSAAEGSGMAMIVGHAVAALIAAVLVMHADALISRWADYLCAFIGGRPIAALSPFGLPATSLDIDHSPHDPRESLRHGLVRRGPPNRIPQTT